MLVGIDERIIEWQVDLRHAMRSKTLLEAIKTCKCLFSHLPFVYNYDQIHCDQKQNQRVNQEMLELLEQRTNWTEESECVYEYMEMKPTAKEEYWRFRLDQRRSHGCQCVTIEENRSLRQWCGTNTIGGMTHRHIAHWGIGLLQDGEETSVRDVILTSQVGSFAVLSRGFQWHSFRKETRALRTTPRCGTCREGKEKSCERRMPFDTLILFVLSYEWEQQREREMQIAWREFQLFRDIVVYHPMW